MLPMVDASLRAGRHTATRLPPFRSARAAASSRCAEPRPAALRVSSDPCTFKGCRQADQVATPAPRLPGQPFRRPVWPAVRSRLLASDFGADIGYLSEALLTGNLWALLELLVKEV